MIAKLTIGERQSALVLLAVMAVLGLAMAALGAGDAMGVHGFIVLFVALALVFVVGGGLNGSQLLGRYPELALGGPDDARDDGRWIPAVSVEEYGGALARWLGVSDADMPYVFPNWSTWNGGGRGPVQLFA